MGVLNGEDLELAESVLGTSSTVPGTGYIPFPFQPRLWDFPHIRGVQTFTFTQLSFRNFHSHKRNTELSLFLRGLTPPPLNWRECQTSPRPYVFAQRGLKHSLWCGPHTLVSWFPGQERGRELVWIPDILNYEIYQSSKLATTLLDFLSGDIIHWPILPDSCMR